MSLKKLVRLFGGLIKLFHISTLVAKVKESSLGSLEHDQLFSGELNRSQGTKLGPYKTDWASYFPVRTE